ncbi:MAG: HAD hydrolase-like protein [Candidatus Kerfeldbacteria bacterium]|nr:HAD hydrolase-like protein [Candidatus Kerfeldbacteria bacterium]
MAEYYFEELNVQSLRDSVILLDIDGTLVPDNAVLVTLPALKKLEELKEHNTVYLCTNSRNRPRCKEIERITKTSIINPDCKKPSRRVLQCLPTEFSQQPVTVIGDKFLTDALFAKRIGAQFIRVKRKHGKDRPIIKIINAVDDVMFRLFNHYL